MAVITPLRSNFAQLDASLPMSRRSLVASRRPVWLVRLGVLLAADIGGFAFAFGVCVLTTAWLAGADILSTAALFSPAGVAVRDLAILAVVLLYFARRAHYVRRLPFWSVLRDVANAGVAALLCDGFLRFSLDHALAQPEPSSLSARLSLLLTWVLFVPAVMLGRLAARRVLARAGLWALRTVVIGAGATAAQAADALLSEPGLGYAVAGIVAPEALERVRDLSWRGLLRQHRAELLVLALNPQDPGASALTRSLVCERVPFAVVPQLDGLPVLGFEQTCFFSHDTVMFTYRNNLAQPVARALKLAFDVAAAAAMLLVAAPVFLLVAAAVKRDGGPVFYAHRRVGARGREFGCLKFRSMVVDSEAVLERVLASDPRAAAEWARTQKLKDDPRVTRIGRFLRATSLDELPQLLNVLRLEMSLVGPRPIVRSEVPRYGEEIAYYYETRPGVTGLWQVSGRSETGYSQRVQLDAWYVKNWTLWHDVAILAKTVPAVLARRGAV